MKRLALAAFGLVALSACASDPGRPMDGPGGPGGAPPPPPPPQGLFVSPFGELFVSEPGAAWPVAAWFAGADADGDGRITLEEFTADGVRWFGILDVRRDDRLTPDEIAAYEQDLAEARTRLPGVEGGRRGPGRRLDGFRGDLSLNLAEPAQQQGARRTPRQRLPTGPMGYGPIAAAGFFNYPQPVKAADLDTNQTVTSQEWAQASERWFVTLDADQDGALTLTELPRTPLQQLMDRGPR